MAQSPTTDSIPHPHSPEWYDRMSQFQEGYLYPWRSEIGNRNGEDAFIEVLYQHLTPTTVALDVGCADGRLTVDVATRCARVVGYDRVERFIETARKRAMEASLTNCDFVVGDANPRYETVTNSLVPAADNTFDLVFSRRGPLNYIHDVGRVVKSGGWIVQLNPAYTPPPTWADQLPSKLFVTNMRAERFGILESVAERLAAANLTIHSHWFFDVPERFFEPRELYAYLVWNFLDNPPYSFDELRKPIERIFRDHTTSGAVEIRHRRFLWKCLVNR